MNLTHIAASGEAHMVDVGDKSVTSRTAIAEGRVHMQPETLALVLAGDAKKAMCWARRDWPELWRPSARRSLFRSATRC